MSGGVVVVTSSDVDSRSHTFSENGFCRKPLNSNNVQFSDKRYRSGRMERLEGVKVESRVTLWSGRGKG